jgi:hypothetical protein
VMVRVGRDVPPDADVPGSILFSPGPRWTREDAREVIAALERSGNCMSPPRPVIPAGGLATRAELRAEAAARKRDLRSPHLR